MKSMSENFTELLFSFKEHLKVKNYSEASIDSYCYNLQRFFLHLQEKQITDIRHVNRQLLKDYQLDITKRYGAGTVSVMIRSVKRFFEQLENTNHILINPAEYLREPKKESRLPRVVLSNDEALKILDQPNLSTFNGIRDRTILEVFYSTGVRLEELRSLTIYDCDLKGGYLRVNKGKFAKDRVIPLGKHAVRFLKEYVTHVRPRHTKNNKAIRNLFVNHSGRPLSRPVIEILVRKYARAAGIQKKVTPHSFRHAFATELVRNGADITAVQKMLGHSRLSVTQLYTKVAGVEVKQTHAKHHPREKDKAQREEVRVTIDGIGNRR
jgi:integrase/recombinase XerD